MTVGFVDFLMVRPFGPTATAAMGLCRQVTFLVEGAGIAIATGVITLVSQGVGARAVDHVNNVVRQSVYLVLILGLPTALLGYWLSRPLLLGMNADPGTLAYGTPYLHVYFSGLVFLWGNLTGAAIFRGQGDVKTPLKLALGINLLNVAANYVFIFGAGPVLAFEVQGAAMGTVLARACAALLYLGLLLRGAGLAQLRLGADGMLSNRNRWGFDVQMIARVLRIGVPMALASVLRNGSRLVFLAIVGVTTLGVSLHAAVGIGLQVRLFSILPALAFQTATATLVGQAIGRGDYQEAEALGRRSVQLLALIMVVVVLLIIVFSDPLARLLIDSFEAAKLGADVLRWFAVAQLFSALSIGTQGALMGAGDTAPTMRYTLVTQWLVMLPLAYAFLHANWVPGGPLLAWTVAPALALLLTQLRWRGGRWKAVRV
jgi:putative MATE family efflux protein